MSFTATGRRMTQRVRMLRWRLRGMHAAPSAVIFERCLMINPRGVHLQRHVQIGAGSVIKCLRGTFYMGESASLAEGCWVSATDSVRIEARALVGPGCHITDADHGFGGLATIRTQPMNSSPVTIGEGAWLGAGAKVLCGVRVGEGAVVGAGAVVTKDVPDFAIVAGVPARVIAMRRP